MYSQLGLSRATVDYRVLPDCAQIWAEFEASTPHQLQAGARLTLAVRLVDEEISIVTVTGSWGELGVGVNWTRLATLRAINDNLSDELERVLYELIANAMAHPDPVSGTPIRVG